MACPQAQEHLSHRPDRWNTVHDAELRPSIAVFTVYRYLSGLETAGWSDLPACGSFKRYCLSAWRYLCTLPPPRSTNSRSGKMLDWDYRDIARRNNITVDKTKNQDMLQFPIEKARLRRTAYFLSIAAAAMLVYGWTLHKKYASSVHVTILKSIC